MSSFSKDNDSFVLICSHVRDVCLMKVDISFKAEYVCVFIVYYFIL